ncbi:hypothetical protein [Brevibacillus dissolubilis]|uniref:hypothetical protein n=1 Tax=Brevibacillus dissolubilis TaxID=1844116 RepID=UPI001116B1EE|nr:hypothetical protein [Brevibacillus dissolubilis]
MGQYTPNKNLYMADPIEDAKQTFNVKTMLNDNFEKIDTSLGQLDTDLAALKTGTLPSTAGSVTDTHIGDRAVDQALTPTGNTGKYTQFLSWFANMIKSITGKANWWEKPVKTLQQLSDEKANLSGATFTGTIQSNHTYAFVSKYPNRLSWVMHHQTEGNALVFAPSGTVNGEDWNWDRGVQIYDNGSMRIGSETFHHTGNHNSTGDPHTQYLRRYTENLSDNADINTLPTDVGNRMYDVYKGKNRPPGGHDFIYLTSMKHSRDPLRWEFQIANDFHGFGMFTRVKTSTGWQPWKLPGSHRLKIAKWTKDTAKGVYKEVQYKRPNDTVYMRTLLSNPDANGNYQTMKYEYYDEAGTTVTTTETWSLKYDTDGEVYEMNPV